MSSLTATSFQTLLGRLDTDPSAAAEKYEALRIKLANLHRWRGCAESHADELADITLDRVAAKLAAGEVVENVAAFASAVARFVSLEHSRKNKLDAVGDDFPETPVEPDLDFLDDPDERMKCMRRCVATTLTDDDKRIVVGYYDTDADEKIKSARKRLADSFGLTVNALKVRACRLRMRLEQCINDCVAGVTHPASPNTKQQEVA
jgi:DNA-directed RNA polymerase specialized sigma24 family protein